MFLSVEVIHVLEIGGVGTKVQKEKYLVWLESCLALKGLIFFQMFSYSCYPLQEV